MGDFMGLYKRLLVLTVELNFYVFTPASIKSYFVAEFFSLAAY
jgi:hypothetical protein